MTEVISVRFRNKGKIYFFDPNGFTVSDGTSVIVDTSKGLEYADCTWGNHWVDDNNVIQPLRGVVRIATAEDTAHCKENREKEAEAFRICQEKIEARELDMKLVDVEYNFEGSKILFFFTSEGRVDFRELVKDLAAIFRTRIELRQIGVRDEAKMLGGLGICGRPFCCSQFLDDFHPVSIKMAKTQGLSLNPTKISGTCGRLMCCLKYEQIAYEDLVKKAPKMDAFVDTPGGKGSVTGINLLRSYAKVRLEDTADTTLKTYPFDELEILGGKARRAEYIAAKAENRLEEAGFTPSNIRRSRLEAPVEQPREETPPFVFADGTTAQPEDTAPQEEKPKVKSKNRRGKKKSSSHEASGSQTPRDSAVPVQPVKVSPQQPRDGKAKDEARSSQKGHSHSHAVTPKQKADTAVQAPKEQRSPDSSKQKSSGKGKRRYYHRGKNGKSGGNES